MSHDKRYFFTKISSIINIQALIDGNGPFSVLGEEIFDDYWMYYLTNDMAKSLELDRPYTNLKEYQQYKAKGLDILEQHRAEIEKQAEEE